MATPIKHKNIYGKITCSAKELEAILGKIKTRELLKQLKYRKHLDNITKIVQGNMTEETKIIIQIMKRVAKFLVSLLEKLERGEKP